MDTLKFISTISLPHNQRRGVELLDRVQEMIISKLFVEKKYRDVGYTAKDFAEEVNIHPQYISTAVLLRFGMSFPDLLGYLRSTEMAWKMTDKRYKDWTIGQIATSCGFANRPSRLNAFSAVYGIKPAEYRKIFMNELKKTEGNETVHINSD